MIDFGRHARLGRVLIRPVGLRRGRRFTPGSCSRRPRRVCGRHRGRRRGDRGRRRGRRRRGRGRRRGRRGRRARSGRRRILRPQVRRRFRFGDERVLVIARARTTPARSEQAFKR